MSYGSVNTAEDGVSVRHNVTRSSSSRADNPGQPHQSDAGSETEESENSDPQQHSVRRSLKDFYERNIGLVFVFFAQTFGSIMSTAAKLLTSPESSPRLHALHIIFVRMVATTILGSLYSYYKKVPDFPLGPRGIRRLLVLRGTAGFIGLFGLYYSLSYLEISDATAISFLVPTITAFVCFVWLREPYTLREAMAGFIALVGVVFVARPAFLFGHQATDPISDDPIDKENAVMTFMTDHSRVSALDYSSSSAERAVAIIAAILGTFGAATAYATIRLIGKRAHSLVSVNYFAVMATLGSAFSILVHPDLEFILPKGVLQWVLIVVIGIAGFLLQFLLTEGLQREKAGRATNVIYIQMVFALIIERVIWGTTPPVLSFLGSALIIGAAIWLSLQRNKPSDAQKKAPVIDEESSLLARGPDDART
ncbi:DUF6-domain-containing protein [Xylariaceae sp. FL0662B]|nr:DUF6-domain-containing protein [Xylariaceae sp. FL0662B]